MNALNFSGSVLIAAGNVIETHEHAGDFKELVNSLRLVSYVDAVAYQELPFEIGS